MIPAADDKPLTFHDAVRRPLGPQRGGRRASPRWACSGRPSCRVRAARSWPVAPRQRV